VNERGVELTKQTKKAERKGEKKDGTEFCLQAIRCFWRQAKQQEA
jgi:hypothetical protein